MGHPYIDICDLILDSGFSKQNDIPIFDEFCSVGSINNDRELFYRFFELQLRKKTRDSTVSIHKRGLSVRFLQI